MLPELGVQKNLGSRSTANDRNRKRCCGRYTYVVPVVHGKTLVQRLREICNGIRVLVGLILSAHARARVSMPPRPKTKT